MTEYYSQQRTPVGDMFFVMNSDVVGPMVKSLVPIAGREAAERFRQDHHGSRLLLAGGNHAGTVARDRRTTAGTDQAMKHNAPPSKLDRTLAEVCRNCPVCRTARQTQVGLAFWLVNRVEHRLCPFCRAYERVYGRKAHEHESVQPRMNANARE